MNNKIKGLIITLVLSLIIIIVFYGKIITDPANYYFASGGDGFKTYYGAIYHMENDTSLFRMDGMNYPFGEVSFFTGCQPFVTDGTKLINTILKTEISPVASINLLMVFSILIAALILFFLFFELGLPWWYSALVAIGISILSPQIHRMGGHFSLSYIFWIPLMMYLLLKFDRKTSWITTASLAIVIIFAGITHLYFIGFYGFIAGLFWVYRFAIFSRKKRSFFTEILHFILQFILPVAFVLVFISLPDNVNDRTAFPFGFFAYRGHPIAVFLPSGKPYSFIRETLTVFNHIQWEALSFIGMASLGGFLAGLYLMLKKVIAKQPFYIVTDVPALNVMFWSSVAALIFSFGIPFIFGLEGLVDFIGPLKQLRALARFSWFFYFALNVVVFYSVYKFAFKTKKPDLRKIVFGLALFFLLFDGLWNVYLGSRPIQNRWPALEDKENRLEENNWVNLINKEDYQAILPLPYFHVGSENIWIESRENTQELAMLVSLKTGLPMTGVQLSRTSIGQTFLNYQLVTEPLNEFKILEKYPNEKPLLLLFNKKHYPNEDELRLIRNGDFIYSNDNMELRSLPIERLKELHTKHKNELIQKYQKSRLIERNGLSASDSTKFFILNDFNGQPTKPTYSGSGAKMCSPLEWNTLIEDTLKNVDAGIKFIASFWIYDFLKDGNLRINLEFHQSNVIDNKTTNYIYTDVHRHIRALDGDWALIEFPFETKTSGEKFKFSLRSTVLDQPYVIDEILIREEGLDLFNEMNDTLFYNTRKI